MRSKIGDREIASASIEERLRASLSAPISEEDESIIQRVVDLVRAKERWPNEMEESLSALREMFSRNHKWSFAKGLIAIALGKEPRTVQRLLLRPNPKVSVRNDSSVRTEKQTNAEGPLDAVKSEVNSVTVECRREGNERAGRRLTLEHKAETDSAYTKRILKETTTRFSSKSDRTRRAAALHIRAQMVALGITPSELENLKTEGKADL